MATLIQAQCGPVVNELCSDNMEDDADILQCLLENIHHTVMTQKRPECRKSLLEVQYFLARDFSYDKHFRKACKVKIKNMNCFAKKNILKNFKKNLKLYFVHFFENSKFLVSEKIKFLDFRY